MKRKQYTVIFGLSMFLFFSLACRLSAELPWEAGGQDVQISAEDVAEAATRAAEAAATAGVLTNQAGDLAATAVSQGSDSLATAQILPTPNSNTAAGATALEQKLANIQTDANGNFSLAITDTDLNEFVSGQTGGGIRTEGFAVDDVQINISSESAELSGNVQEPMAVPLTVEMRPTVQNGRLYFDILSATAGIFPAPESMLDLIEVTANNELAQALAGLPDNMIIQNVQLGDGVINISGQQQ